MHHSVKIKEEDIDEGLTTRHVMGVREKKLRVCELRTAEFLFLS